MCAWQESATKIRPGHFYQLYPPGNRPRPLLQLHITYLRHFVRYNIVFYDMHARQPSRQRVPPQPFACDLTRDRDPKARSSKGERPRSLSTTLQRAIARAIRYTSSRSIDLAPRSSHVCLNPTWRRAHAVRRAAWPSEQYEMKTRTLGRSKAVNWSALVSTPDGSTTRRRGGEGGPRHWRPGPGTGGRGRIYHESVAAKALGAIIVSVCIAIRHGMIRPIESRVWHPCRPQVKCSAHYP
jgi:hypothetical protein